MAIRGLAQDERELLRARLEGAFAAFTAVGAAYELPGAALCAAAR